MNVNYINPFIASTIETYKIMLHHKVKPGNPSLKKAPPPTYDIAGNIGLSGDAQGVVALAFAESSAMSTVATMLGTKDKLSETDLIDGIGELVNIVAGHAKKDLTDFKLDISLPNVAIGKNVHVAAPTGTQTILVPFFCEIGDFQMEIALRTD